MNIKAKAVFLFPYSEITAKFLSACSGFHIVNCMNGLKMGATCLYDLMSGVNDKPAIIRTIIAMFHQRDIGKGQMIVFRSVLSYKV